MISIPTFALTRSIVLLDLTTLESYELKFGEPLRIERDVEEGEEEQMKESMT